MRARVSIRVIAAAARRAKASRSPPLALITRSRSIANLRGGAASSRAHKVWRSSSGPGSGFADNQACSRCATLALGVTRYVVLLRGINVGGKNIVPMARLRDLLIDLGYTDVATYIASGNVILSSDRGRVRPYGQIEAALPRPSVSTASSSRCSSSPAPSSRPSSTGGRRASASSPTLPQRCDLPDGDRRGTAMGAFDPRPGVDTVWPGEGVIYSQRLSAERTQSRLSKVMGSPLYTSMTIRNWATTIEVARAACSATRGGDLSRLARDPAGVRSSWFPRW